MSETDLGTPALRLGTEASDQPATPVPRGLHAPGTPVRSDSEAIADGMVLVLGVAAVLVGAALLLHAAARLGRLGSLAIASYLLGLFASFSISTVYNMAPLGRLKSRLRRYDHAAIFLLIAGTYTAIAGLSLPSSWSLPLLGLVWSGAVVGMALKLFAVGRHERLGLVLYLGLGWVGIVALLPLTVALTHKQFAALCLGGLIYTGGVAFYLSRRLRFRHALWHVAVLSGSAAHYLVVLTLVRASP